MKRFKRKKIVVDKMDEGLLDCVQWWFSGTPKEQHARWFQPNPVARAEIDRFIRTHYISHLKQAENAENAENAKTLALDDPELFALDDPELLYSYVILLDQFSRHVYRGSQSECKRNTEKAVDCTVQLLNNYETFCNELSDAKKAFLLMPLKHHNVSYYYDCMIFYLQRWNYAESVVLMRFWKDLLKRYSQLENQKVTACKPYTGSTERFAEITEFCPESFYGLANNANVFANDFAKANALGNANPIIQEMQKRLQELDLVPGSRITVSLSGGVDSMVILWALKMLQQQSFQVAASRFDLQAAASRFNLQAVHLNYRNRDVSDWEADFVRYYCTCLKVPLYIRTITEIHRKTGEAQRDHYESHTRDIRFGMYQHVGGVIVLGHMHDDVIENIWTNFARGRDLFNLPKMEILSEQNDVQLWRPLLETPKSTILEFSKTYGIAFLLNTTPAWSNRGKFRATFLPQVHQQYGPESDANIELMARSLKEYHAVLQQSLFQPFLNAVVENRFGFHFELTPNLAPLGLHFWQTVLAELFHKRGLSLPSRAALNLMVATIKTTIGATTTDATTTDATGNEPSPDPFQNRNYIMLTLKLELFVRMHKTENGSVWMLILEKKKILSSGVVTCESENKLGLKYWKTIKDALGLDILR